MKIFSAKLLILEFETWCLLWLLRQVRWGEKKKNPPTGFGIEAARRILFLSEKAQTLEPNSVCWLIFDHGRGRNYEIFCKHLIRAFHVRWTMHCWFHHRISALLVMWMCFFGVFFCFFTHTIEQTAYTRVSQFCTCEHLWTILIMLRTKKENA